MEIEIKELSIDDYDEIIRIWSISGLPYKPYGRDSKELIAKEMALDITAFYGLYIENNMVGVAIANYDGRRGWINRLAIDPDYRGKQFASILIDKCEIYLKSKGALVICALIEDINTPSLSTFERSEYVCENNIIYLAKRPSPDA